MAVRLTNKIPSLVNNVVLRQSSCIPRQFQPILTAGFKAQGPSFDHATKTRYPLNQQDANSYIEGLKAKASCLDVVKTFNVLVSAKPDAHPKTSTELNTNTFNLTLINGQRNLASKAGDKKKDCKKPCKKEKDKCPKMSDNGKCPKFKMENCEKAKNFICTRRPFIFPECKKMPAPYPSFSEACYEGPYPSVNECRDCPWAEDKHPTYKRPKDKYGPPGRKFFHTDARCFATKKNMNEAAVEKLQAEDHSQAYETLNRALFDKKVALRKINAVKPSVQILSRPPRSQRNDLFQELYYLKQAAQRVAPVNAKRIEMLLMAKRNQGPRHKLGGKRLQKSNKPKKPAECDKSCNKIPFKPTPTYNIKEKLKKINNAKREKAKRGKSTCKCDGVEKPAIKLDEAQQATGGMFCKMVPKEPTNPSDMTCEKLAPSPVCPKDLLNRKSYPRYRKEMKKRVAKEKEKEELRKAIKARRKAQKPKPKNCGVMAVETVAVWCGPGSGGASETKPIENMNVILAKDRVKIQGEPKCPKNSCDQGAFHKKKCPKKIKSRVCPKDLLDRKPYKKFRESKTKCKKGKGKKGKRAAGANQEQMSAMMMEAQCGPSATSRPDAQ